NGAVDHGPHTSLRIMIEFSKIFRMQGQGRSEVLAEDLLRSLGIRTLDFDLDVQASGSQDCRIDHVLPVGGSDDYHVFQPLDTVDLTQQLRHDRVLHVGRDTRTASPEQRIHLVEENDHRHAITCLVPGALKDQPDMPLGLANVLIQQLRPFDVQEEAAPFLAGSLADLLRQRVGDSLGDQGLATAGRPVQQDSLRCLELVLGEEFLVKEGQLDCIPDRLDLAAEATDQRVVDVGHLFQHQLFNIKLRYPLVQESPPTL